MSIHIQRLNFHVTCICRPKHRNHFSLHHVHFCTEIKAAHIQPVLPSIYFMQHLFVFYICIDINCDIILHNKMCDTSMTTTEYNFLYLLHWYSICLCNAWHSVSYVVPCVCSTHSFLYYNLIFVTQFFFCAMPGRKFAHFQFLTSLEMVRFHLSDICTFICQLKCLCVWCYHILYQNYSDLDGGWGNLIIIVILFLHPYFFL